MRLEWLSGLIDNETDKHNKKSPVVKIKSTNHEFIMDLRSLLLEIGVSCVVNSKINNDIMMKVENLYNLEITEIGLYRLLGLGLSLSYRIIKDIDVKNKLGKSRIKTDYITNIYNVGNVGHTYCGTEPIFNRLMFNGILTGNCQEYYSPIKDKEITLCNLGSINLAKIKDKDDLESTVNASVRLLDNVIDVSTYLIPNSEKTQKIRRSIGLGTCGEGEVLANKKIICGTDKHIDWINETYGFIKKTADNYSKLLGSKKGACIYSGQGYRNFHRMCIAPTSAISIIMGTTASHEGAFDKEWIEENKLGSHRVLAPNLTKENFDYYKSPYDINQIDVMRASAVRQKYLDMGQSNNLYFRPEETTGKDVFDTYIYAWKSGIISIYYVRSESLKYRNETKNKNIICDGCEG